jgi:hypothetical protein
LCQKEEVIERDPSREVYAYTYSAAEDTVSISRQQDVIIYDALRFGPIARLGTCDVFPAEAVYACIEVKSIINGIRGRDGKTDLQDMLQKSFLIRDIKIRQYNAPIPTTYIHTMLVVPPIRESIQIRTFAFVLESQGAWKNPADFCTELLAQNNEENGFYSALYIHNLGLISSHHSNVEADADSGKFEVLSEKNALAAFKNTLYTSLYRFPRPEKNWAPAIDRYYELTPTVVPVMLLEKDLKGTSKNSSESLKYPDLM